MKIIKKRNDLLDGNGTIFDQGNVKMCFETLVCLIINI